MPLILQVPLRCYFCRQPDSEDDPLSDWHVIREIRSPGHRPIERLERSLVVCEDCRDVLQTGIPLRDTSLTGI